MLSECLVYFFGGRCRGLWVQAGLKLTSSSDFLCFSPPVAALQGSSCSAIASSDRAPPHRCSYLLPKLLMAPNPSQGTEPTWTYVMRWREQSQKSISMARSCLDSSVSLFRHSKKSFSPPWGPSSQINAQSLGSRSSRYVRPGKGEKPELQAGTQLVCCFFLSRGKALHSNQQEKVWHPEREPQQRGQQVLPLRSVSLPSSPAHWQPCPQGPGQLCFIDDALLLSLTHGWRQRQRQRKTWGCLVRQPCFKSDQLRSEVFLRAVG